MKILRILFYFLIFLLAFAYIMVFYLPINYFKAQLMTNLPSQVSFTSVRGSIAKGEIENFSYNGISVSKVKWAFNPILLRLKVDIPAKKDWHMVARLGISSLNINLRPGALQALSLPYATLDGSFDGNLAYEIDKNMQCKNASGEITSAKVAVVSPIQTGLKNLSLNLACIDGKTAVNVNSKDTNLNATLNILIDKNYMSLNAKGKLGEHDLTPLLETIVHPKPNGNFEFTRKLPLHF